MRCLAVVCLGVFSSPSLIAEDRTPPWPVLAPAGITEPLPGTQILTEENDLSHDLIKSNDRFFDRQIELAAERRNQFRERVPTSLEGQEKSVAPNKGRLAKMLGVEPDAPPQESHFVYRSNRPSPLLATDKLTIHEVTWKAFDGVNGYALLIEPFHLPVADIIVIPDAVPAGLDTALPTCIRLAHSGCRVLIPGLVGREENGFRMSQREWIHRPAFVLGRTLIGYETDVIRTAAKCLLSSREDEERPLALLGHGHGGHLALIIAALDSRFTVTGVTGSFGPRERLWQEPAYRNIFGFLNEFGYAEVASLVWPRPVLIEYGSYPDYGYRSGPNGPLELAEVRAVEPGKPGFLPIPTETEWVSEIDRLRGFVKDGVEAIPDPSTFSDTMLVSLAKHLEISSLAAPSESLNLPQLSFDQDTICNELIRHNEELLHTSAAKREVFFRNLKTDSLSSFEETIEPYRETFRTDIIGDFGLPLLPPNARTRPYQVGDKTLSYEVVLDVMEEGGAKVFAYGILTLPKDFDLYSGEKRPVVVCQHGLEGAPQDVIGESKHDGYKAFATRLAERGFITFAPQNGYKYFDLFRMQQFKAQSIGKTLFSVIVPQHRQITEWLAAQPWVDGEKIAFYGLSYGGKSAMRIPPLVDRYCLSICSADFNEWVWKNAATDQASLRYSYAGKSEYEIFEWNLGGSFNYAEMASLICPRPFMVERGHFDGVAPDERVAFEFAKVRNLYSAKLGIAERCEIEVFPGPHTINGVGTFDFLHRHLEWPAPKN